MALSAFYIHKRSVDQVLHRLIEIRRAAPSRTSDGGGDGEEYGGDDHGGFSSDGGGGTAIDLKNYSRSMDENNLLRSYRISSSLPNVASRTDWFEEDASKFQQPVIGYEAQARASSLDNLNFVASGLPPLRMDQRDGMILNF